MIEHTWIIGDTIDGRTFVVCLDPLAAYEVFDDAAAPLAPLASSTGRNQTVVPVGSAPPDLLAEAVEALNQYDDDLDMVSTAEAAEIIGIKPHSILGAVSAGRLKVARQTFGANQYRRADVEHYRDYVAGSGRRPRSKEKKVAKLRAELAELEGDDDGNE